MAEEPEVPTSSHFTSPETATPRAGQRARGGVCRVEWLEDPAVAARDAARRPGVRVSVDVRRQTSIGLQVAWRRPPAGLPAVRLLVRRSRASAA